MSGKRNKRQQKKIEEITIKYVDREYTVPDVDFCGQAGDVFLDTVLSVINDAKDNPKYAPPAGIEKFTRTNVNQYFLWQIKDGDCVAVEFSFLNLKGQTLDKLDIDKVTIMLANRLQTRMIFGPNCTFVNGTEKTINYCFPKDNVEFDVVLCLNLDNPPRFSTKFDKIGLPYIRSIPVKLPASATRPEQELFPEDFAMQLNFQLDRFGREGPEDLTPPTIFGIAQMNIDTLQMTKVHVSTNATMKPLNEFNMENVSCLGHHDYESFNIKDLYTKSAGEWFTGKFSKECLVSQHDINAGFIKVLEKFKNSKGEYARDKILKRLGLESDATWDTVSPILDDFIIGREKNLVRCSNILNMYGEQLWRANLSIVQLTQPEVKNGTCKFFITNLYQLGYTNDNGTVANEEYDDLMDEIQKEIGKDDTAPCSSKKSKYAD